MKIKLREIMALAAVTLALVWCIPSVGQVLKGSISGTVTDPQGAVVSGAQVKAKNVETGVVVPTTSDNSGTFRLNLLPVGTYNVEITAQGFKTTAQNGIAVSAGSDRGLGSVHLSVGEATTTVEVTTDAPLIETTQAQVTNTFSGTTLQTFAGIQENEGLDNLALFVPGVSGSRSNNFSNSNGGGGFTVNGLRGRNNDQQIDGQNNNDNSVGGPGLFLSNAEFVQQYVLVTNQFGPEYGRNAGSVVNIITKSGGNAWHGSVYGTEGNSFLNALSNGQKRFGHKVDGITPLSGPPRSNDEFTGMTIGGPLMKNKMFIFGGFDEELIGQNSIFQTSSLTPTPAGLAQLAGCFPSGAGANAIAALTKFGPYGVSAGNPQPFSLTGSPTTVAVTGCGNVPFAGVTRILPAPFHGFDWVAKTDLQLGSDVITGRYLFNRGNSFNTNTGGSAASGYPVNVPALSQIGLISWTHNFTSRMVNESRISYGRLNVDFGGNQIGNTVPTADGLDQAVTNVSFNSRFLGFGPATNIPQDRIVNTWQAQDNWNYVLGKHNFKSGVNWTYQRSPNIFLPTLNGQFRFTNFNNFTTNLPNRVQIAEGPSDLDFREYDTFLYFGDDWKIGQNLTLNLGLTWSYYGQPANLFNDITTKRESSASTAFWNPAVNLATRTLPQVATPTNSFGPSIGFAYSPQWGGFLTGHGKTVFRGGYRLLYDPPFYNIYLNIASSAPEVFLQTFTTGLSNPQFQLPGVPTGPNVRNNLASQLTPGVFDPRTFSQTRIPTNFGPDKVHAWSFGFEREITKNSVVEIRYAGNHGLDLFQSINDNPFISKLKTDFPNLVPANLTPCPATQQVGTGAGTDVGRVRCGDGVIRNRVNTGISDYHGVQTEFRANNLFKQLTIRTGYTWSKTTDNVSEIFGTGTAGNTVAFAQNPLDVSQSEHGTSGLDFTHRWTMTATEYLPFFQQQHGVVGHLLGGWGFNFSYQLGSGQPWTPTQVNEATATGGNYYDNTFNGTFVGVETARPFNGNSSAPLSNVGIFLGDACTLFGVCTDANGQPVTASSANRGQLISMNALGKSCFALTNATPACSVVNVTNNDVRFIINTKIAQTLFGTPFGNAGRNPVRDAITNTGNMSVFKRTKLTERTTFEFHATALNVFNHFNFASVDPFLQDAGLVGNGTGFGDFSVTGATGRRLFVGAKITF